MEASARLTPIIGAFGLLAFGIGFFMESFTLKAFLFGLVGILASGFLFLPYKWAIVVFFGYLSIDGFAKIMTGYNPVIHVGSDILAMALVVRVFLVYLLTRHPLPTLRPPLLGFFAAHFVWFLIEFANPYSLGLFPSLAGAKVYVTMVVLYGFGFYLTNSSNDVRRFLGIWAVIAFLQTITSLYQASLGPISVLSLSPNYAHPLSKITGAFRPFGTTALPGGGAILVYLTMPFIVYFIIHGKSKLTQMAALVLAPLAVMTLVLCQIRSALIKCMFGVTMFIVLGFARSSAKARTRVAVGVPVIAAVMLFVLPRLTQTWVEHQGENAQAIERTMTTFDLGKVKGARAGALDRIIQAIVEAPLGAGLSRTGSAAGKFAYELSIDPYFPGGFFADNFWAAVIHEVGIPGAFILTSIVFLILWKGVTQLKGIRSTELAAQQAVLVSSLTMVVTGFWGAEGIMSNPEAAYFWFFSGVLMRIPTLDDTERA